MRKFSRLLLATLLAISLSSALTVGSADTTSVGDPGESWSIPNDADRGMHVQIFIDSFPNEVGSALIDLGLRQNKKVDPTCKSASDPRCASQELGYDTLLPFCGPLSQVFCIEEFGIQEPNGSRTIASHLRHFPNKALNEFAADPALKLPFGGTGSIFELPEAKHDGGSNYYVSVRAIGSVNKQTGANLGNFSMRIFPVKLEAGDGVPTQGVDNGWRIAGEASGGHAADEWISAGFGFSGDSFCVAGSAQEKMCAQLYAFPANKKFYLKVRLQVAPSGWLHGRIYQPDISITQTGEYFTLDVSANPVAVPVAYKMFRWNEMPAALRDQYDVRTGLYKPIADRMSEDEKKRVVTSGCGRSACSEDPNTRNVISSPGPAEAIGMELLKVWLPYVNDQATALMGTWSVRTLEGNEQQGASQCFTSDEKGITGIVTTNATQYSGGPPKFNKDEQTLEYQVAAPHLTPQKSVFLGSYDLLMRSDVARCVYGFSSAPIKASLSIVTDGVDQKVATEALGEKNGWVFLSAAGFTYSDPTIKVKLTQDAPQVTTSPTPSPSPTPTSTESATPEPSPTPTELISPSATPSPAATLTRKLKKVTITCVKGRQTKKITGINPKCPTGYKRVGR